MFNVEVGEIKRADVEYGAAKVGFRVGRPRNTGIFEQSYQMLVGVELRLAGLGICQDAEVGAGFEPQVIWLTGMVPRRVEIPLGVRSRVQELPVGIRGQQAAFDIRVTEFGAGVV